MVIAAITRWLPSLTIIAATVLSSPFASAQRNLSASAVQSSERRVALVIGNSAYSSGALENPKNDATAVFATLKQLGFDAQLKLNVTKSDMDLALRQFGNKAEKAKVAVLFYAGHGIQVNGDNYLVPIGAAPKSVRDLKRDMVKLDDVIDDMTTARVKLVFFDACRDNPLSRSFNRGSSRGLAAPVEATGTLISFATKHGNTAADGTGRHSPYTEALLAELGNARGVEIEQLLRRVQQRVRKSTDGQQEPWRYGSLDSDFFFLDGGGVANLGTVIAPPPQAIDPGMVELTLWDSIKTSANLDDFKAYLDQYPNGQFAALARARLAQSPAATKKTKVVRVMVKEGHFKEVRRGGQWVNVDGQKVWEHKTEKVWVEPVYREERVETGD